MGAQAPTDVWITVQWDKWDRLLRRGEYRYELRLLKHDFNHQESCYGKCSKKGAILGVFLGSDGVPDALDVWFRVPWDGQDIFKEKYGYRYELKPLLHGFNPTEPWEAKSGFLGSLLGQILILHRKWPIEKSKNISWWQIRFRRMWCSWKCKIHRYFPELKFDVFQIFFYMVLFVP